MLRVGIMLDSSFSSAWVERLVERIQTSSFARITLTVFNASANSDLLQAHPRLFRVYERWDYKRNKSTRDALGQCNLAPLLKNIPSVSIEPVQDSLINDVSASQVEEILPYDLDVLLRIGFRPFRGRLFEAARFGIWSVSPDDTLSSCIGPALLWQLFDRSPVTESRLLIQSGSFAPTRIALRSYAATDQASLYRSRNPVYWKTAELVLRGLRDLHERRAGFMQTLSGCETSPSTIRPIHALHMLHFMGLETSRWLKARFISICSGAPAKWVIAIRRRGIKRFDDPSDYRVMPSPDDRFYADPFLIERVGKTFLFFEDFRYDEGRAVISCCELDINGVPGQPVEVLRRPYHLSYPFLFEDEGELYMIPETRENRTLELYRAVDFPLVWAAESTLLSNIDAVDATVQRIDGKLWMFTSLSNGDYSNSDELSLFSAPALRGPWTPHPCNPVVSDVQRSRPAGMLFRDNGRLIRPSQDCGKAYGYALVFSEVLTLTETEYREQPIGRVNPESVRYALSTHTYNRTESFEVIDRTLPARIANSA